MKVTKFIEKVNYPYQSVDIISMDTNEHLQSFTCFYEATDFMNKHGYSVVLMEDQPHIGHQQWKVRCWKK